MQEKESFSLLFILSYHNFQLKKKAFCAYIVSTTSTTSTCSATSARAGGETLVCCSYMNSI